MKLKIATVLATGVIGAVAGFVLGYAYAGPGGWLGPMPLVAGMFIATYLAILGLAIGTVLSTLSNQTWPYLVVIGAIASLVANAVLALLLGGGLEFSGEVLFQGVTIGAAFGLVYKVAGNWLSRFE